MPTITIPQINETLKSLSDDKLSEQAVAKDWNLPEEDEAWANLQKATSQSFRFLSPIYPRTRNVLR